MRLDLSHIRQPDTSFLRQYDASAFAGEVQEYRVVSPVSLACTVHKDHDRFRLVGTVATTLELPCSRCLEPFRWPVNASRQRLHASPSVVVTVPTSRNRS